MSESVSRLRATCFEIRRTPPEEKRQRNQKKLEDAKKESETEYVLDLVPFGNVPHILFDNIKLGEAAIRSIVVKNPTNKPVHVTLEKLPKPEKGFEVDYVEFDLKAHEEGQLQVGWVPQSGTPLRETISIKFNRLKTQMLFVATCKLPPSMISSQRKPLRPSSVQNLKRPAPKESQINKKNLPANPVIRQAPGTCPPTRPYSTVEDKSSSKKFQSLRVNQEAIGSWSPQPFRMVENADESLMKAESFVASHKGVFDTFNVKTDSPRRETFIVPNSTTVVTSVIEESVHQTIRRETFVTSTSSVPLVTSTPGPASSGFPGNNSTFVFPSEVKKPLIPDAKIEEAKRVLAEVEDLDGEDDDETMKKLSDIKEETTMAASSRHSNVPQDIDKFLEISGVDLSLSPEKKDISGFDVILEQTMSQPPRQNVSVKLSLSSGNHTDTDGKKLSSQTFVCQMMDSTTKADDELQHQPQNQLTFEVPAIVETLIAPNDKEVLSVSFKAEEDRFNISSETYVKSPMSNFADEELNLSHLSTGTYVKSPKLAMIVEDNEDDDDNVEVNPDRLEQIKKDIFKDIDVIDEDFMKLDDDNELISGTWTVVKSTTDLEPEVRDQNESIHSLNDLELSSASSYEKIEDVETLKEEFKLLDDKIEKLEIKSQNDIQDEDLGSVAVVEAAPVVEAERDVAAVLDNTSEKGQDSIAEILLERGPENKEEVEEPFSHNNEEAVDVSSKSNLKAEDLNVSCRTYVKSRHCSSDEKPISEANRSLDSELNEEPLKPQRQPVLSTFIKSPTQQEPQHGSKFLTSEVKENVCKAPVLLNISPIRKASCISDRKPLHSAKKDGIANSTFKKFAEPAPKVTSRRSIDVVQRRPPASSTATKRRSLMPPSSSNRLTLIKPMASSRIVSHPNPYAARNMYYDERWIEKQENGFKKWLNFVLTPPDDWETSIQPGKLDVAKLWSACTKDVKVPRAPTREVLSVRAYTTIRELNSLRRNACLLWQSPALAKVVAKIETEIEMHRIILRQDRQIHKDLGVKKKMLLLLLNYNPLWLRIGLETVFGQIIPMEGATDVVSISQFVLHRLLSNPDILAMFAHPTVPHHYREGHEQALRKFTLKKILSLIYFLDQAKTIKLIKHNPCLFVKDSNIKMSRDLLVALSKDFLSGEGDFIKHLGYLGYEVKHKQTMLDEFDFAVTNIATDLKCGVRLCRIMEILTHENITEKLRIPVVSRLQSIHNVELALKALARSEAGMPPTAEITSKDLVNGHMEKTLALLWHLIFGFQLGLILNEDRLTKEIAFLEKSLKFKASFSPEAKSGLYFIGEKKRRDLQDQSSGFEFLQADSKNDWAKSAKFQLLLKWASLVGAHYGLEIENLSTSFSDGRALCFLVHHYYPEFLPRSEIHLQTTQHQIQKQNLDSSLNNSFGKGMTYSYGQNGEHLKFLANEKENFKILHMKVQELGGVPMLIRSTEMSNTIPDQKVTATFLTYLAARLLDLSVEMQAARTIQFAWKKFISAKREAQLKVEIRAATIIQNKVRIFLRKVRIQKYQKAALTLQANFRGFLARKRAQEMRLQIKYENHLKATVFIQKCIRGFLARKAYMQQKEAALTIQKVWRGFIARKHFQSTLAGIILVQSLVRQKLAQKQFKRLLKSRCEAATKIQTYFRRHLAAQKIKKLRQEKAAVVLQKHWKGKVAAMRYQKLRTSVISLQSHIRRLLAVKAYRQKIESRSKAAILIQSHFRRYQATKHVEYLKRCRAATMIQKTFKAYIVRKNYVNYLQKVVKVQSLVKMHLARTKYVKTLEAVIVIQKNFRMVQAQNLLLELRAEREAEAQNAAVMIQKAWKMYAQRRAYITIKQSVIVLQSFVRMTIARKKHQAIVSLRHESAIIIQKNFRQYLAFKQLTSLRREMAAINIQKNWKAYLAQKSYQDTRSKIIKVQSLVRKWRARKNYVQAVEQRINAAIVLQSYLRRRMARKQLEFLKKTKAATMIQKHYKGYVKRSQFMKVKKGFTQLQALVRMRVAKVKYAQICRLRQDSAVMIQKHFRGYLARSQAQKLREEKSSIILQKYWRGYVQRSHYELMRKSTICIQSFARMCIARRNYLEMLEKREESAVIVQSVAKMFLQRRKYARARKAAVTIQKTVRMHQAKALANQLRIEREHLRNQASITIQSHFRRYLAMKLLQQMKVEHQAALTIQKMWKGYWQCRNYNTKRSAAICIQKNVRMWQAQKLKTELARKRADMRNAAAVIIQSHLRRHLAQNVLKQLKLQHSAAIMIQKTWKGFLQRRQFVLLKCAVVKLQSQTRRILAQKMYRSMLTLRNTSAITIQKNFKRLLAQNKLALLKKEKAATILQKHWKAHRARQQYYEHRLQIIKVQAQVRQWLARKRYVNLLEERNFAAIRIQSHFRRHMAQKELERLKQHKAAVIIQKHYKSLLQRRRYKKTIASVVKVQSIVRRNLAMKKLQQTIQIRNESAAMIQKVARGFLARCSAKRLKKEKAAICLQKNWRAHAQRSHYLLLRNSAILIQSVVRMRIAKKRYQEQLARRDGSATLIQATARGFLQRTKFAKMLKAATCLQKNWRARAQRSHYLLMRSSATLIQSVVRMRIAKKRYQEQLAKRERSATLLQATVRGFLQRTKYVKMIKATVLIQKIFRMHLAQKLACELRVQKEIERNQAAVTIQANFRRFLAQKELIRLKLRNENAAICLQKNWRAHAQRSHYLLVRNSAILIQSVVRMRIAKKRYQEQLVKRERSATLLQATVRGFLQRTKYVKMIKATVVIQKIFRMHLAQKLACELRVQKEIERNQAAVTIQANFRRFLAQKELIRLKRENHAAVTVQRSWKGFIQRREYLRIIQAAITIQKNVRMVQAQKCLCELRKQMSILENHAAIQIQCCFRRYLAQRVLKQLKKEKAQFELHQHQSAALIQATFKMYQAKQLLKQMKARKAEILAAQQKELAKKQAKAAFILQHAFKGWLVQIAYRRQQRAATLIKAAWKGYKLRMAMKKAAIAKRLAEVQKKVSDANKNATEEQKLCNRTAFALDYLFDYKDMAMLIVALHHLDVSLRYSTNCCSRMFENDSRAIYNLMDLMDGLNRSVPHIEVMTIILDILISLAEFHETRPKLAEIGVVFDSVLTAWNKGDKNAELFGKCCSLFWRLAAEPCALDYLKDDKIFKKLSEFEAVQNRKKKTPSSTSLLTSKAIKPKVKKLSTKHGCQLTDSIVRFHSDPHVAIGSLMKRLRK